MTRKVEATNIRVSYNEFEALQDINFTLENGKVYGLIGRNGAGKTSLLSVLAAYRKATSGEMKIDGVNIFENEKAMAQVTFVHQTDYKDNHDTITKYFDLAERFRPTFDRKYAEQLVQLFHLPTNKPLRKLSAGMQSAFNVTIGLASRTPVTIFDEAYQGMDAPTREIFYNEVLEEQARNPRIFILSTHLISEMEYLFDEVLIIHQGTLLLQEEVDTLLERGYSVTGPTSDVIEVVAGLHVLNEEQLGGTKSMMLYGELTEEKADEINRKDLEIGNVSLHELFIHLTKEGM
ncbi:MULTISPECIES: ATP-binding cassette domain-containing protein [unclassified Sporosarcina]|uniref:ATP-binding cassette domain-containing protein n=1 Tax=unclassified Sporosarcina TaxID=2647733 RepID=UPI000C16E5A1|nr:MULTISPECIES: ABC transporter ATP-binding protein [unclassified Sporosarcina]PIC99597.1 ABC transporter [Sporosarcina sp. P29]PID06423.1 ABC transporter [Sporosarcina sp. P30]PID09617.1 ABC transporter [Sporosarcina sp. P31]PID13194.1 ABC transporter [Sporosarcina sp. P32b]